MYPESVVNMRPHLFFYSSILWYLNVLVCTGCNVSQSQNYDRITVVDYTNVVSFVSSQFQIKFSDYLELDYTRLTSSLLYEITGYISSENLLNQEKYQELNIKDIPVDLLFFYSTKTLSIVPRGGFKPFTQYAITLREDVFKSRSSTLEEQVILFETGALGRATDPVPNVLNDNEKYRVNASIRMSCYCHQGDDPRRLLFNSLEELKQSMDPRIMTELQLGQPAQNSDLFIRVLRDFPSDKSEMPPFEEGNRLDTETLNLLERWILTENQ